MSEVARRIRMSGRASRRNRQAEQASLTIAVATVVMSINTKLLRNALSSVPRRLNSNASRLTPVPETIELVSILINRPHNDTTTGITSNARDCGIGREDGVDILAKMDWLVCWLVCWLE